MADELNIVEPDDTQDVVVVTARRNRRFDISDFRTEINTKGVLQNNRFVCVFSVPKKLKEKYGYQDGEDFLTLRCETVTVPGQNFFTQDVKRYGYGQIERKPYLPAFNPMKMVFVTDRSAKIIKFFEDWAQSMVNHDVDVNFGEDKSYLVGYKEDYICPVLQIFVYNEHNELTFSTLAFDCFPITISEYDVSWTSQNDLIRLSVSMQFVHSKKEFYNEE